MIPIFRKKIFLQLNLIIFENTNLIITLIRIIHLHLQLKESLEMIY